MKRVDATPHIQSRRGPRMIGDRRGRGASLEPAACPFARRSIADERLARRAAARRAAAFEIRNSTRQRGSRVRAGISTGGRVARRTDGASRRLQMATATKPLARARD